MQTDQDASEEDESELHFNWILYLFFGCGGYADEGLNVVSPGRITFDVCGDYGVASGVNPQPHRCPGTEQ